MTNNEGESEYMCCKCPNEFQEKCHSQIPTPADIEKDKKLEDERNKPTDYDKMLKEADEEMRIMEHLKTLSAQQIMEDLIKYYGHPPPAFGEGETWRFYYLDECKIRGVGLLEELGWSTDYEALYVNRFTGTVETLIELISSDGHFENHTIENQVWHIIECWLPFTPERYIEIRGKYLMEHIKELEEADEDTWGCKSYYKQQMEGLKELRGELNDLLEDKIPDFK